MIRIIIAVASLIAAMPAQANWTGKSELGFVMARGNAETETANAKLEIARELDRWKHTFGIGGLYGKSNDVTSAQRWDVRWQTDYQFSDRQFWFGSMNYEENRYSGFAYQGSVSFGMGHKVVDRPATKLTMQLGAGYRNLQPEQLIRDESGAVVSRLASPSEGDAVANGAVRFEHAFNDSTKILDALRIESGQNNTLVQNDVALQVKMTEVLALSLGVSTRTNSKPPEGLKKTDTSTTINLVYELK